MQLRNHRLRWTTLLALGGLTITGLAAASFTAKGPAPSPNPAVVTVPIPAAYAGSSRQKTLLQTGQARGLSLASGDLDEDGIPDLIAGYAAPGGGILTLHRGNPDALYPNAPAARKRKAEGRFTDAPFLSPAQVVALPERPDLIGTGDFDGDGHQDVVVARKGGNALYWLRGDGHGGMGPAQKIELPGEVTALTTGEINRADGLTDVVVGVNGPDGAQALVFESPRGALKDRPESIPLPAPVSALLLGSFDENPVRSLAVAAGADLLIVHGRDRKLSLSAAQKEIVPPPIIKRLPLPSGIVSLAAGDFTGMRPTSGSAASTQEIAALNDRGTLFLLNGDGGRWHTVGQAKAASGATTLLSARLFGRSTDDLITLDDASRQVRLLTDQGLPQERDSDGPARPRTAFALPISGQATAILPMRLSQDSLSSLVVLREGQTTPIALVSHLSGAGPQNSYHSLSSGAVTTQVAGIVVNSEGDQDDGDTTDGVCDTGNSTRGFTGVCTLRAAIETANANGGTTITFVSGVQRIAIGPVLPRVTAVVTIDGSTNGGRVELDGTRAFGGDRIFDPIALSIRGGNSTVRSLVIHNFNTGIEILLNGGDIIENCLIGTDTTGTVSMGNGTGILCFTSNNLIGGTPSPARNVISGNSQAGVNLAGGSNKVQGNYIGTDATGRNALGNGFGVAVEDSSNNLIGGTDAGAGNIISGSNGNPGAGGQPNVAIEARNNPSSSNLVQGNYIGTDSTGTVSLGCTGIGVLVSGSFSNVVGGTTVAARNIIAGSTSDGVSANHDTLVQGNYIGTDVTGTVALPNKGVGISWAQQAATIGGAIPAAGNLISGNLGNGVTLSGANSLVQNNLIGTDASGTKALGNGGTGVQLGLGTDGSQVLNNVVSANGGHGVFIAGAFGGPQRITIQGNKIGSDQSGTVALGNKMDGIRDIEGANNIIGGPAAGAGNEIVGNGGHGVEISGSNQSQNKVQGNFIGTDPAGTLNLGNTGDGVLMSGQEFIGGLNPGEGNLIAFNRKGVVYLSADTYINGNAIYANTLLGLDWNDDGATPNQQYNSNKSQEFPILSAASVSNGMTFITGNYMGTFGSVTMRIEFFASPQCDPSGFGQGQIFLGAINFPVNGLGNAPIQAALPIAAPPGYYITSTASFMNGQRTSEFSNCAQIPYAAPTITSISPGSANAGGGAFVLTVNGTGFAVGSQVQWNGQNRTTTLISPTQLQASIPASDIANPTTATITVVNPAPGGGTSNSMTFAVNGSSAIDVSGQVRVTRSGLRFNRATGRFVQTATLTNTGSATVPGPVSLVLDSLSSNAALFNSTGTTSAALPAGSPYINVLATDMAAGSSVTVTLEFTDPTLAAIGYTTRVLAGPGSR